MKFNVVRYKPDGQFDAVISGLGRNAGTWDAEHSKRSAQRHVKALRQLDALHSYKVEAASHS